MSFNSRSAMTRAESVSAFWESRSNRLMMSLRVILTPRASFLPSLSKNAACFFLIAARTWGRLKTAEATALGNL